MGGHRRRGIVIVAVTTVVILAFRRGGRNGWRYRRYSVDDLARLDRVLAEASWDRWENERRKRATTTPRVADRARESHRALFDAVDSALASGLGTTRARELAAQYRASLDADSLAALKNRATWPSGMRQWVASLYERTADDWDRVLTFIVEGA